MNDEAHLRTPEYHNQRYGLNLFLDIQQMIVFSSTNDARRCHAISRVKSDNKDPINVYIICDIQLQLKSAYFASHIHDWAFWGWPTIEKLMLPYMIGD
jgi:hypothetical protein